MLVGTVGSRRRTAELSISTTSGIALVVLIFIGSVAGGKSEALRIVNQHYIRSCPGGADIHRKCGRRKVRGTPQANISIEFYRRRNLLMDTGEKAVQDRVVTPCVPTGLG